MASHVAMDDVDKALAILPPELSAATQHVTAHLLATLDVHIQAHNAARSYDSSNLHGKHAKSRGFKDGGAVGHEGGGAGEDPLLFEIKCHYQVQKKHVAQFVGCEQIVEEICHYVFDRPSLARPVCVCA